MADEKQTKVQIQATQLHDYLGTEYAEGDTYDADPAHVDTIIAQGKGVRAEVAKAAAKEAKQQQVAAAALPKKSAAKPVKAGKAKIIAKKRGR